MKIAALDLETTGLEISEGHRIIEVCILTYDWHSRALQERYVQRIDPDRAIAAAAQAVHGISYTDLMGCPKWHEVAPEVAKRLDACGLYVIHNAEFDMPFIGSELQRVKLPLPNGVSFCTMENARWACPDGKNPRLGELCFALGVPYDPHKAHGAAYDVSTMVECFWRGVDRGFYKPLALLGEGALA